MAATLETLSIISFVIAGISLVLAVFFWIFFKIPTVIGDLSGRTARKSIAKMRAANEKTGSKSYKASKTNMDRGMLTDPIEKSGQLNKKGFDEERPDTGVLSENKATIVNSEETAMLESETTGLLIDEEGTAPLDVPNTRTEKPKSSKKLTMLDEVVCVHTNEKID